MFWAIAVVLIPTLRAGARVLCRHLPGYTQNAVIVGGGRVGQQLALKLSNHREYGIHLVGVVDPELLFFHELLLLEEELSASRLGRLGHPTCFAIRIASTKPVPRR